MMKAKTVMSSMTETVIDLGFCRRGIISEGSRPHRADDLDRAALSDITATEPTQSYIADFVTLAQLRGQRGTSVRRILVRGVNAPLSPEAKKILSPHLHPPFKKLLFFACFRFLIFHPFSRRSADPICPYVRTPIHRGTCPMAQQARQAKHTFLD